MSAPGPAPAPVSAISTPIAQSGPSQAPKPAVAVP
jgi:hypothetical protein